MRAVYRISDGRGQGDRTPNNSEASEFEEVVVSQFLYSLLVEVGSLCVCSFLDPYVRFNCKTVGLKVKRVS